MQEFKDWLQTNCKGSEPVFVGFNAPFDWSFVNYYFHRFIGNNPFGFSALDIKAYFMGLTGCAWEETRSSRMSQVLRVEIKISHNALDDALVQAGLFERLQALSRSQKR